MHKLAPYGTPVASIRESLRGCLNQVPLRCSSAQRRPVIDGKFFHQRGTRLRVFGFTYGPFRPSQEGEQFPERQQVEEDFLRMLGLGANSVRTYHVPPPWLLDAAGDELNVLIDVPWSKHLCFLDSPKARAEARHAVSRAASVGRDFANVLAYSIGNEIPPDIIRWHGARRIERFLSELMDACKQTDPEGLVTFGNYPPAEYLDLSFLDFVTFNVYLHDRETFRRYLCRLQNLVGDKPLVLGEIGMDTLRKGELAQAEFLAGHLEEASLIGLAGSFVFSWTDEWYTGDHEIRDWAFGVTARDRTPKASYFALSESRSGTPTEVLPRTPRVSVIVCSYNGDATLAECLQSLGELDYPDYEVILVDDGSTDNTRDTVARFPWVKAIHQSNLGLSEARNVGLQVASGEIVAYTDSDCYVDRDWLTLLIAQLLDSDAVGVGGPNYAPHDGFMATCVGASPGQPTHVLESDQVAEHIPGCNMAFRREALEAINGFDPQFRKAGDDVDICWRLQQAGHWIAFAPAAFVWHHRRQDARSYLRQQAGYGEAEALLRFKHPDKFNGQGNGKWGGVVYGSSLQGLILNQSIVYRGTFGCGFFQCIYRPGPAHWAMIPGTLEWQVAAILLLPLGFYWAPVWTLAGLMLLLTVLVAVLQGVQAKLPRQYNDWRSRALVALLCYCQPLVRSTARYRTRYLGRRGETRASLGQLSQRPSFPVQQQTAFWAPAGTGDRTGLLHLLINHLQARRCGVTIDTGWSESDLEVFQGPWTAVHIKTAQEEHGSGNRLVRVAYQMRLTALTKIIVCFGVFTTAFLACFSWAAAMSWLGTAIALVASGWYRWAWLAARIREVADEAARKLAWLAQTGDRAGRASDGEEPV
jgi:GT2 family glycosyltransferase